MIKPISFRLATSICLVLSLGACAISEPSVERDPFPRADPIDWCDSGKQISFLQPDGVLRTISLDAASSLTDSSELPNVLSFDCAARGTQLAAVRNVNKNYDILIIDVRTKEDNRLVHSGSADLDPVLSPDGDTMVFESNLGGKLDLYLLKIQEGAQPIQLTDLGGSKWPVVFSPDGTSIVFTVRIDANDDLYLIELDQLAVTRLTHHDLKEGFPAWSPAGDRIAYVSNLDGDLDLYTMKPDGSDVAKLTHNEVDDAWPDWSPDGRFLVYSSTRDGNEEIYRMDMAANRISRLTYSEATRDFLPKWSPSGNEIAYWRIDVNGTQQTLMSIDADGRNQRELITFNRLKQ